MLVLRMNDLDRILIDWWWRVSVKLIQVKRKWCIVIQERSTKAIHARIVEVHVTGQIKVIVRFR